MLAEEQLAYELLDRYQVSFDRLDHPPISSVRDVDVVLPGQQVKNLFLKDKKGRRYYLYILPDEKQANLKALAAFLGESRLSFASDERVEELLHVLPGTITPFGLYFDRDHLVELIVDSSVDSHLTVGFHPFVNSTTLNIAYSDFQRMMEELDHPIRVVDISAREVL